MNKYKCDRCSTVYEFNNNPSDIVICDCCGRVDIPLVAINISNFKKQRIFDLLKEELKHTRNKGKSLYEWTTKSGKVINLRHMPVPHIRNVMQYLEEKYGVTDNEQETTTNYARKIVHYILTHLKMPANADTIIGPRFTDYDTIQKMLIQFADERRIQCSSEEINNQSNMNQSKEYLSRRYQMPSMK